MKKVFLIIIFTLLPFNFLNSHTINKCYCDEECFTKEISNIKCEGNKVKFKSKGLPNKDHELMLGIKASNQQFPSEHDYLFEINTKPKYLEKVTMTEAGALGVAVNGVPLFDPSTQGPKKSSTGKPSHAYDVGELDNCGGHAGRGDDYHYHIAPKCLIEELGDKKIEIEKKPIGFAMDGFPILALGWFDKKNDVEGQLDKCRGMKDEKGNYFYNVMSKSKWDILNCFHGKKNKMAKDKWRQRKDKNNKDIVGRPIKFKIQNVNTLNLKKDTCHSMYGTLENEQLLLTNQSTKKIRKEDGTIFHCNSGCYGLFFEADKKPSIKGRAMYYDFINKTCPIEFNVSSIKTFEPYLGPPQQYKGEPEKGGKKKKNDKKKKKTKQ